MARSNGTDGKAKCEDMERLADRAVLNALRRYLHGDTGARRALLWAVPRRGAWFLCEVDGRRYAVRVTARGRVEIMENLFDRVDRAERLNGRGRAPGRERELPLPLFQPQLGKL